jgi:hypothetical protein
MKKRPNIGKKRDKRTATETNPTDSSDIKDLIAVMQMRKAGAKESPERSEEEANAGGEEIVRLLALLAPFIPSNSQPQTELEAKQERLRQKLANLTFKPPHKTKQ